MTDTFKLSDNHISQSGQVGPKFVQLFRAIKLIISVRSERRMLGSLDDVALKDIGISRIDAINEANRSNFDIPKWRMREAQIDVENSDAIHTQFNIIKSDPIQSAG